MRREVEPEHDAHDAQPSSCAAAIRLFVALTRELLVTWSEQPAGPETPLTGLDIMCLVSYLPEITSYAHEQASAVLAAASQEHAHSSVFPLNHLASHPLTHTLNAHTLRTDHRPP